ncbi:MAG: peptidoglycan/LPS O-acetylase OafA/YrhL [Psychroserpens sp.]|jgi:peptidoglycan/LPS O-acetylase OafA/YrhL
MRISILDGFRAIAIISVMLYHYFSRWIPPNNEFSLYPYNDLYDHFNLGKLGVQFFFIISGFVIYFTLEKTEYFTSFWQKRLIRLLPSMIVASFITLIFCILFDKNKIFPGSHSISNFIPSFSFVNPSIFNEIFGTNLDYISGSYWSLWPEIQFYFFVSLIFYINKKRFLVNFVIISIGLIMINYLIQHVQGSNKLNIYIPEFILVSYDTWIFKGFNLISYLPFFSIGIAAYVLYENHETNIKTPFLLKIYIIFLFLFIIYSGIRIPVRITYALMIILFIMFIFFPKRLSLLENSKLTSVGESSYFLYLIHENIGVIIIYNLGQYFLPNSFVLPVILIITLSYLSILFTKKVDKPINNMLKKGIQKSIGLKSLK